MQAWWSCQDPVNHLFVIKWMKGEPGGAAPAKFTEQTLSCEPTTAARDETSSLVYMIVANLHQYS